MQDETISLLKSTFNKEGYLHIPGFFSRAEIETLQAHLEDFIRVTVPSMAPENVLYEDSGDSTSLKQLFHMSDSDPYFKELLMAGKIAALAENLLGEKMSKGFVEYFNKPPKIGKPTPPHQDSFYFMLTPPQAITFWVPLENTDPENGCLIYVRGSHLKEMRPHGRSQIAGFSQGITDYGTEDDLKNEISVPAKVTDILIHHGMTIHRADGNTSPSRSRKVMGFVYFGESAQEDLKTKEAYQQNLKKERFEVR